MVGLHAHRRTSGASMYLLHLRRPFLFRRKHRKRVKGFQRGNANKASIGNRSSYDESKSDGPEDETTVVEPEQGNGEDIPYFSWMEGRGADIGNV